MADERIVLEWVEYAAQDMASAEFLMGMTPIPVEIVCYHCEQAAEKMLKAFLLHNGVEAPRTHHLGMLCSLCMGIDQGFVSISPACLDLDPYGVHARYPFEMEIMEEDTHNALVNGRRVVGFIQEKLKSRR